MKRVNGSDADSEGSDCEKENQIHSVIVDQLPPPPPPSSAACTPQFGSVITLEPTNNKLPLGNAANQMRQPLSAAQPDEIDGAKVSPVKLRMTVEECKGAAKHLLLEPVDVQTQAEEMAPQQRTPQKRLRPVDTSKFNRSARKSKNCATFYFKHLDTDGENQNGGGFSSQNDEGQEDSQSDELLENDTGSGDSKVNIDDLGEAVATSEDEEEEEEWVYTTNNKLNSTTVDVMETSAEDSLGKCIVPQISISEDSVFERSTKGSETEKRNGSLIQLVSFKRTERLISITLIGICFGVFFPSRICLVRFGISLFVLKRWINLST